MKKELLHKISNAGVESYSIVVDDITVELFVIENHEVRQRRYEQALNCYNNVGRPMVQVLHSELIG